MSVNEGVVPNDQRRDQLAFFEDIFFKLLVLIVRKRRNLILELWVDFQIDHIKELLKTAQEITELYNNGKKLGLTQEELAFYDALTKPENIKDFYQNNELIDLTRELTEMLRKNRTIDWQKKETARASMRKMVKHLLKKYKYPPEDYDTAISTVISQCEMWTDMTAVIYARYSSDNQCEESIEGQIRECTDYAEKNGITVIKHYIDRAFSAKTDNRPEFQQMIRDSSKKLFDVVLVWKFDRFARNRFDSANYKMILKKNGVHLISVMEPIAEGSQGILVETLLEGMAEYYSAELSEKVIRGQTENALKGKCTGGTGTIGYKIDDDKFYHLDPLTAPLVLEAFQRYDNGDKMVEIVNFLNDKGVRNMLGGKMTHSSVNTMLKNRRYIGELSFRDIVVPDAIPVIVPKDLFDRVQKRLDKNKRAPACGKADEEYLLTTKLFCGKCGALMFGESGTSATGRTYYYYKCANVKRRKGCNKKTVQKDWLEDLVVRETMKLIQDNAVIDKIVQLVMDVQNQENTTIPLLEKQLREVNKKLDNLMKAIEDGLYTRTTKERLEALEIQKDELTAKIADEKLKKPSFNEDFIRFWLMKFRKFDISQKKQRKALIEIFVNAIFLYDDRMLLTFNYKDGTQTVRFEDTLTADSAEEKSSDLFSSAGP